MDLCQKKQEHLTPNDPYDAGDAWIWRAIALPSRLRVVSHLSHERSEKQATAFLGRFKGRCSDLVPLFTSDKLPAYTKALIANYSMPEPLIVKSGRGRPREKNRRIVDADLLYAQIDKIREGGRVVEVKRRIIFGTEQEIKQIIGTQQINTAYIERDNLTSRQSNGRLVRKTLSHSKSSYYLQRHIDLEDAVYNFVRVNESLKVRLRRSVKGQKWKQRTPAMASGITDHVWSLEEMLSYRLPPTEG
jgi:IS1 family transposase